MAERLDSKSVKKSKTVWFNAVTMAVLLLGALLTALGSAPAPVSPWVVWAIGMALTAGNIVLRVWFTDTPISTP